MTKILILQNKLHLPVWRGAPDPLLLRRRNDATQLLESLPADIAFRVKVGDTPVFTLAVGSGITLATDEGVPNALAMIQLSEAQSLQVRRVANPPPAGSIISTYELTTGPAGNLIVLLGGQLIGEGAP